MDNRPVLSSMLEGRLGNVFFILSKLVLCKREAKRSGIDADVVVDYEYNAGGGISPERFGITPDGTSFFSRRNRFFGKCPVRFVPHDEWTSIFSGVDISKGMSAKSATRYMASHDRLLMDKGLWWPSFTTDETKYLGDSMIDMELFNAMRDDANKNILHTSGSTAIHVRRTDFLLAKMKHPFEDSDLRAKVLERPGRPIVIFTDDVPWCKNSLSGVDGSVVYARKGVDYEDVMRMAAYDEIVVSPKSAYSYLGKLIHDYSKIVRA